jgi:hypothetical protein
MKNTATSLGLAFLLSAVAVIVVFVQVVFVQAEAANSRSGDVLEAERACAKAWVDADIATLDRFIANDYVEMIAEPVREGVAAHWRTQTKQGWLDLVRSRQKKYVSVEIRNEKVFLHGDDLATVLGEYSQTVIKDGKQYNETGPEIDTWKKRNGHWQVISSVFP